MNNSKIASTANSATDIEGISNQSTEVNDQVSEAQPNSIRTEQKEANISDVSDEGDGSDSVEEKEPDMPTYESIDQVDTDRTRISDLPTAPVQLVIDTLKDAKKTNKEIFTIIEFREWEGNGKSGKSGKSFNNKTRESELAILCIDKHLYRLGAEFGKDDTGDSGLYGGVKPTNMREYGINVSYRTKSNGKLGKMISLLDGMLMKWHSEQVRQSKAVVFSKQVGSLLQDSISRGSREDIAKYAKEKDFIFRPDITLRKCPSQFKIIKHKITKRRRSPNDIEYNGKWIHEYEELITEDNISNLITRGMRFNYAQVKVTIKASGMKTRPVLTLLNVTDPIPQPFTSRKPKQSKRMSKKEMARIAAMTEENNRIMEENTRIMARSNKRGGSDSDDSGPDDSDSESKGSGSDDSDSEDDRRRKSRKNKSRKNRRRSKDRKSKNRPKDRKSKKGKRAKKKRAPTPEPSSESSDFSDSN